MYYSLYLKHKAWNSMVCYFNKSDIGRAIPG